MEGDKHVMDDMQEYMEAFREEAEELLVEIEESLLILEGNPMDMETVGRLFRAMHTIKGSGAMFGFDAMSAFTHHLETVLDQVRHGRMRVSRKLIDLVLASRDQIALMVRNSGEIPEGVDDRCRIIEELNLLTISNADEQSAPVDASDEPTAAAEEEAPYEEPMARYVIRFTPDECAFGSGVDPTVVLNELRSLGECSIRGIADRLPDIRQMNPEGCYLEWEIELLTDAGVKAVQDAFIFVEEISSITIDVYPADYTPEDEIEAPVCAEEPSVDESIPCAQPTESTSARPQTKSAGGRSRIDTIKVPSDKLDALVNLVGELVITQAQLRQAAEGCQSPELAASVEQLDHLASELREVALSIRMVPIGSSFGRFKRLVRDLSIELGKEIELLTEGEETELDKTEIDRLSDPLVHLIRNSIDHGIEPPDAREACGKPRAGTIRLSASQRGASVVIAIADDGRGIDTEAVHAKALSQGIISADQEPTEKELLQLIFAPGFSTTDSVTNLSGRGVGMDVVRKEIESLNGSVSVSSRRGEGTVTELSLPLTLAIIDGLLLQVGEERFVAPLSLVEGCLELTPADFAVGQGRSIIRFRDEIVPFVRLRELFEADGPRPETEEMIIINWERRRLGIVVDEVIGDHQTVIKSLGGMYKDVEGVSGATILGDGAVALILDVEGLVHCAEEMESRIVGGPACVA